MVYHAMNVCADADNVSQLSLGQRQDLALVYEKNITEQNKVSRDGIHHA